MHSEGAKCIFEYASELALLLAVCPRIICTFIFSDHVTIVTIHRHHVTVI